MIVVCKRRHVSAVEGAAISGFEASKSRRPKIEYDEHLRLKEEKGPLEKTIVEQAAELALLKKRSLGLGGDLKGKYLDEDSKRALVELIGEGGVRGYGQVLL